MRFEAGGSDIWTCLVSARKPQVWLLSAEARKQRALWMVLPLRKGSKAAFLVFARSVDWGG